jgi:hypothetical protein
MRQVVVRDPQRLRERLRQRARQPGMPLVQRAPQHHDVHDREDPRAAEVVLLGRLEVLEQRPDARCCSHAGRPARADDRAQLAVGEHRREVVVRRDRLHPDPFRQVERELLLPRTATGLERSREVPDTIDRHAVFVCQQPALPHARGELVLRRADPPAGQVLRPVDAVDVHRLVPEAPRREHRQRHERWLRLAERQQVRRQAELADIELAVARLPVKRLLDGQREERQLDALGSNAPVLQRAHPVVVPAGERQP